ncbi:DUF1194 domain-containing protein [Rhodovarius crocodyli]|uniref:DUF1194 domain-containing protein n=1 Tax=Rhodovarius crocodyli TaxID=1979269 RepID=A0A437M2U9_9PROT|nr:DUF1194 domain-containing protein [Rhodovarius crocodyli]RVT91885.1 DUF1194 domain-containing protein [Rhodovarius crocodyli]
MVATACAVALVLLLDASGSVSAEDWRLQREGTADAIASQAVARIVEREGAVAMTAIAFSDSTRPLVPWRVLDNPAALSAFAGELRAAPRGLPGGTAVGRALDGAMAALDSAPCAAEQEVIDIATDGEADAPATRHARGRADARGVRINAIGIGGIAGEDPADWLRENAVTPGGFALRAAG